MFVMLVQLYVIPNLDHYQSEFINYIYAIPDCQSFTLAFLAATPFVKNVYLRLSIKLTGGIS